MNKINDITDFFYYERKKLLIITILIIVIVPIILFAIPKAAIKEEIVLEKEEIAEEVKEEVVISKIMVDIKGEVNSPGCYEIDSDKRVKDLIEIAGGLTKNASVDGINLSAKLSDEMVIVIDKKETVKKIETDNKVLVKPSTSDTKTNGKISINKATKKELMTLTGIGESKANSIIDYRTTKGPFKSLEDIKKVKGIGDSIFAKIKDYITL